MHRVISSQVFQSQNEESEPINKRLCCSFLLTTAFLSIIGGFLLGRYTTEKAMIIRQNRLCGAEDEKKINNTTTNLSYTAKAFTILSRASELNESSSSIQVEQLYNVLKCQNDSLQLPSLSQLKNNLQKYSNVMLNNHIESLTNCINNATIHVQQIIKTSSNYNNNIENP